MSQAMKAQQARQIKDLQKKLEDLRAGIVKRPEVRAAWDAKQAADKAYTEVFRVAKADIEDEAKAIQSDIYALKEQGAASTGLDPTDFTEGLQRAYDAVANDKTKLLWVNNAETYFLIQVPGESGRSGLGTSSYAPTEYKLYRTALVKNDGMRYSGMVLAYEGGRMNKSRWDEVYKRAGH